MDRLKQWRPVLTVLDKLLGLALVGLLAVIVIGTLVVLLT